MPNVVYSPNSAAFPELAPKDPDSVISYSWDWTDWLDGEDINTSEFTVPDGITKDGTSVDGSNKVATVQLSGGTSGEKYLIANKITTPTRTAVRSAYVRVVNR